MLVARGLALAAGCSGSGSDGATPVVDIGACSGNACGTLLIGLTAADGDFVSYSVDVFSVTFERRNGAVVETLPAATRVDFAHAYAGHGFAVARDSRSRRLRPRHDPPRLHECLGVRRGRRRSRESHDRRDAPLGVTEVDVRLANGNHVVVTRGRAAFRALDFDLAASHDVDVAQSPPVVITRPYIAAEVQPIHEKELRVRGALVDVDTAGASYTVDVRPWYRRDGNHGRLTIATTSTTAFEIDGVGEALSVVGYINAYGAAPPDFDGRTVVDRRDLPATIGIGWRSDGTLAPFVSVGALGLVLDPHESADRRAPFDARRHAPYRSPRSASLADDSAGPRPHAVRRFDRRPDRALRDVRRHARGRRGARSSSAPAFLPARLCGSLRVRASPRLGKETFMAIRIALPLASSLLLSALAANAQNGVGETSLTIYSTSAPGGISADVYRPVPGQPSFFPGQSVPGFAIIRQERMVDLVRGPNRLNFTDVAAYIDPTTVTFESLTAPDGTRVIEQSFQFDLVSTEKLMERYLDEIITVDQLSGDGVTQVTGRLLGTQGGLVLRTDSGEIHAITNYQNVHFPTLPGGLMTRPTLVWDVVAERAGRENTRVTYQTTNITWWADYNVVFSEGRDANNGFLDIGAWVSILNRSGTGYPEASLKLIAGDVNRVQPTPPIRMARQEALAADASGFAERSFFEFHLYTLGRRTTIPDNSTKQIELFPQVQRVPAQKLLVYQGAPSFGIVTDALTERDYGGGNTRVDVYLEFENREAAGLGIPLPAGRMRVSQLDEADDTLEFIGEDVINHTPRDETVRINLGSAFDVVGERRQVDFQVDTRARRMEEAIEVTVRNHKDTAAEVIVRETLFRAAGNDVLEASHRYERRDAQTVEFPVQIARNGEAVIRYRVRYDW